MMAFSPKSNGSCLIAPNIHDIVRLMVHLRIKVNSPLHRKVSPAVALSLLRLHSVAAEFVSERGQDLVRERVFFAGSEP